MSSQRGFFVRSETGTDLPGNLRTPAGPGEKCAISPFSHQLFRQTVKPRRSHRDLRGRRKELLRLDVVDLDTFQAI